MNQQNKVATYVLFSSVFGGIGFGMWMQSIGAAMVASVLLVLAHAYVLYEGDK